MSTELFRDGAEASASELNARLKSISDTGQKVLDDIEAAKAGVLLDIENGLRFLNSRRQRASRIGSPDVAARFLLSDMLDIDQTETTATIRIDSESASLRERSKPSEVLVRTVRFSTSKGTVERFGSLYRVHADDRSIPTGTFDVELVAAQALTLVVFDLASSPSAPEVSVGTSENGVRYFGVDQVSKAGYRVNAWLPTQSVRFVRISITPTHPDSLNGTSYTFGLTTFSATAVDYHLRSEVVTHPVLTKPAAEAFRFRADGSKDIHYFISLDDQTFFEAEDGARIPVPGAQKHLVADVTVLSNGLLGHTLASNWYPSSLRIESEDGKACRLAPGLIAAENVVLTNEYIAVQSNGSLMLRPTTRATEQRRFKISYVTGPASLKARLRVRLATQNHTKTPVFRGAKLENA